MAQPTVTARPATWSGTSGPILYKLTSTNYSNAGYRFEVEIWDATSSAKIADAVYSATSAGLLSVDVSAFLKANMSLDNNSDLTSGTIYDDNNWIKYYIKYQEVWTASSESQVNDSTNYRYAIYGGLQLGVVNNLTAYIDDVLDFLMLVEEGKAVKNHPFTFNFKGWANSKLRVVRKSLGSTINTTDTSIITNGIVRGQHIETGTADTLLISLFSPSITLGALSTFTNQGSGTSWTTGANPSFSITGAFATTKKLAAAFAGVGSVSYAFAYNFDTVDTFGTLQAVGYQVLDSSYNVITSGFIDGAGGGNFSGTINVISAESFSYISLYAILDDSGGGAASGDINSFTHSGSDIVFSEVKTIDIVEECDNTIVLQWRNSLGGDECFPFQVNQEYTWHYSDRKAKRLTLFADNLTLNQWEAIQGLNTLGELYKKPITEMTTALNRTMATIGQAVYILNSDGTKIGVNVIGSPNTTNTKQVKHSAFVTIEYPELLLQ